MKYVDFFRRYGIIKGPQQYFSTMNRIKTRGEQAELQQDLKTKIGIASSKNNTTKQELPSTTRSNPDFSANSQGVNVDDALCNITLSVCAQAVSHVPSELVAKIPIALFQKGNSRLRCQEKSPERGGE